MNEKGFVYIMTNPGMPGLVKVGRTSKTPTIRAKELSSTGVPDPFEAQYYVFSEDMHSAEAEAHRNLQEYKYKKEFFKTDVATAISAIEKTEIHFQRLHPSEEITETPHEIINVTLLRSEPCELSNKDVRDMIKKYNFYCIKSDWSEKYYNESGNFENDFVDNKDGTVTDKATRLMWQQSGSDELLIYKSNGFQKDKEAQTYIRKLNRGQFAGYSDWRLPTLEELMSLMEDEEVNDRNFEFVFDDNQGECWSSDKFSSGPEWWSADFNNSGHAERRDGDDTCYVRAVRSRQCDVILLRSEPCELSGEDVYAMLMKYDFYNRDWNDSGDFKNDFIDNKDGTVSDRATGLMWQQSGLDKYVSYKRVQTYINELNDNRFAGYSDWRLPTLEELMSLMEDEEVNGRKFDPVFDDNQGECWSSDKFSSRPEWWCACFNGDGYPDRHDGSSYVRAVRSRQCDVISYVRAVRPRQCDVTLLRSEPCELSEEDVRDMIREKYNFYDSNWNKTGSFKNDFVDNKDGTVTDKATRLMWQQSGSDNYLTYKQAKAYIKKLNRDKFAGHSDWRPPTLEELASLLEIKEVNGWHIDPIFDSKQNSNLMSSDDDCEWGVYFRSGHVYISDKSGTYYVRCVRGGQ